MANNKIYNIINSVLTVIPHRMLLLIFLLSSCICSLKPVVVNEPHDMANGVASRQLVLLSCRRYNKLPQTWFKRTEIYFLTVTEVKNPKPLLSLG